MGVLKNDVGRPTNKVKNTRLIIRIILLLFLIGIIVIVCVRLKNHNEPIYEDSVDSEKILTEVFGNEYSILGMQSPDTKNRDEFIFNYNRDEIKTLTAIKFIKPSKEKEDLCKVFECKYGKEFEGYKIEANGIPYSKEINVYEENEVEKTFKEKFVNGKLSKNKLNDICVDYIYKDGKYYELFINACAAGDMSGYPINYSFKNFKSGNTVTIEMAVSPIRYDKNSNKRYLEGSNGSKIDFDGIYEAEEVKKFVKENAYLMNIYSLKFVFKDGKYRFVEQYPELRFKNQIIDVETDITEEKENKINISDLTTKKIYKDMDGAYNNEYLEVYFKDKKIDFGLAKDDYIFAVSDINVLEDIMLFNISIADQGIILVIIDENGKILQKYIGNAFVGNYIKKLSGDMYRGKYSIIDNKIYIESDNEGQDPEYSICTAQENDIIEYKEVIKYKNNKLSDLKIVETISAEKIIKRDNVDCSWNN